MILKNNDFLLQFLTQKKFKLTLEKNHTKKNYIKKLKKKYDILTKLFNLSLIFILQVVSK